MLNDMSRITGKIIRPPIMLNDMSRMTGKIIRPAPAEIEFKNMRFLITEQPQEPDTI